MTDLSPSQQARLEAARLLAAHNHDCTTDELIVDTIRLGRAIETGEAEGDTASEGDSA